MIEFKETNNLLILSYSTEGDTYWIKEQFENDEPIRINRTFYLSKEDVDGDLIEALEKGQIDFRLGKKDGDYYHINSEILDIELGLYIHKDIELDKKFFVANRNISVFRKIENILAKYEKEIRIGTAEKDNLPFDIFQKIISEFPSSAELDHYSNMRLDVVIKDYLETNRDYEEKYNNYMNKKASKVGEDIYDIFDNYEVEKYQKILDKLNIMLSNEDKYSEKQWQIEIMQIIKLIYPKYIAVFENVKIRDVYKPTNRFLDFMLVDANGNVDIVEIKKPFGKKGLVTTTVYRDNHVPVRELSGSIMQIEKYIFYLNKWGKTGEDTLTTKYVSKLPKDFRIKVTNPGALIIMGRNHSMNTKQEEDFEIIKRKFKNVIDILTYDDLVKRLENTIEMFRKSNA